MAEKTKADLLAKINSDLEKKNADLLDELRVLKSDKIRLEAAQVKLDKFDELQNDNVNLKAQIKSLNEQNQVQARQIEVLINGLNRVNESIGKHFEFLNYSIKLAKQDYDKIFESIQIGLNQIQEEQKETK